MVDIVSLRLDKPTSDYIDKIRGNMKPGVAIKKILAYLQQFEVDYGKDILGTKTETNVQDSFG